MNGELASLVALCLCGNEWLSANAEAAPDLDSANSAFQFVNSFRSLFLTRTGNSWRQRFKPGSSGAWVPGMTWVSETRPSRGRISTRREGSTPPFSRLLRPQPTPPSEGGRARQGHLSGPPR